MSGPYQDAPEITLNKYSSAPVKLGWFQRWFLKHSQQAWENKQKLSSDRGPVVTTSYTGKEIHTRDSIDLNLIRADGGWIVQFQTWDDRHDRQNVHHHIITDSEEFGSRLAEIITLQCIRK